MTIDEKYIGKLFLPNIKKLRMVFIGLIVFFVRTVRPVTRNGQERLMFL